MPRAFCRPERHWVQKWYPLWAAASDALASICAERYGQGKKSPQESLPMSIDESTAARVAKLARIKVEPEALPELAQEFNGILGFIEELNEVDVEGVEPMTSVTPQRLKRREDVVTDGNQQDKVLSNAPDAREGFFAVPKVVE